ncbi:hypothetical protein CTAYLR_004566 [Chrysophaeum taylorii]|uniref:Uncharacterized protein n=1 Tax=Chrysophaeum taylorii TaxID=2483200 RepID=A0AAD7XLQ5_9STRA|nr:hypothetical protein CTAYLR_004566 [Chrysophaeum taylorii]
MSAAPDRTKKIRFLHDVQSVRALVASLASPRRRGRLVATLPRDDDALFWKLPSHQKKKKIVPRRARSTILTAVEREALCASKAYDVELEAATDEIVPKKLELWGASEDALDLSGKALQRDDFGVLEFLLRFNYPFRHVSLAGCYVDDAAAITLIRALRYNVVLADLHLSRTKVSDASVLVAVDVLRDDNATLASLDLRGNDISEQAAEQLARLDLSRLDGLPVQSYSRAPPTRVDLARSSLRTPQAVILRQSLLNASLLEHLDLSQNAFDARAAEIIADVVRTHPRLRFLDLSGNNIGARGLDIIALDCVAKCPWLRSLKCGDNGDLGDADALRRVLRHNTTLTRLDVTGISDERKLQASVAANRAIHHTPEAFTAFLDRRFDDPPLHSRPRGGYVCTLDYDPAFIARERQQRPAPRIVEDDNVGDSYYYYVSS